MAITLATLRSRVRQRIGYPTDGSGPVTDAELNAWINESAAELYGLLVLKAEDYYTNPTPTAATIAVGNSSIALPADFYKLRKLQYSYGGGWVTLSPRPFVEFNDIVSRSYLPYVNLGYCFMGSSTLLLDPSSGADGSYRYWYVPKFTDMVVDADTMSDLMHWEAYPIVDAAIKALAKEESDVSVLMAQKQAMLSAISQFASDRDVGRPGRIVDASPSYPSEDDWL